MSEMGKRWQYPHRRWNPLRRSWVMVSPHRTQRPWLGEVSKATTPIRVNYEADCYLCPGNTRTGGEVNPVYGNVFSFVNDFAAVLPDPPAAPDASPSSLLAAEPVQGICKVLCFHPDHSLTLATMKPTDIRYVIDAWACETEEIGAMENINHIQIFENRGAMMGASMPHPHCQIWATSHIPDEPALEVEAQAKYLAEHGTCLLCDYLSAERAAGDRIVVENEHFTALVPWWAVWPFETMILSRRHCGQFPELDGDERDGLADILKRVTSRYDHLFDTSFPYTMGFHQSPVDTPVGGLGHPEFHFHAHFYPPLLRSATVRKFMVGFEMLGMPQRDITPEDAAARLRSCAE